MGFEIPKAKNLQEQVFNITNEKEFANIALAVFRFQYGANNVYRSFCEALRRLPENVTNIDEIPFLPIQFFKSKKQVAGQFEAEAIFKSSGTTGDNRSTHFVKDISLYEKSFLACFQQFYGSPADYCILGLLPSYIENGDSSLVYMVNDLVKRSGHPHSGFYLYNYDQLYNTLKELEENGQKTILFGVSYALLDFAEAFPMALQHTTIIETGGMKGRKKELTKAALYKQLRSAFSVQDIHAEYGMTELLSQAYGVNGVYKTPPWMKILLREETDPFSFSARSGIINVIDFANLYSCSFIATDDLGKTSGADGFEVLGRVDNSDVRGCSQLVI